VIFNESSGAEKRSILTCGIERVKRGGGSADLAATSPISRRKYAGSRRAVPGTRAAMHASIARTRAKGGRKKMTKTNLKRGVVTVLGVLAAAVAIATFSPTEASAQRNGRAPAAEQAPAGDGVVNIQTATLDQLQLLPGIGPAKAQAILTHREQRAFRTVEDIMRVRGIGRATFRRLRPMLTVQGPTTLTAQPSSPRSRPAEEGEQ
jgi:competence protein ComEA